jgi:acetyl-CoA carboxylase carboxyl transferase subunit alpha
VDEVLQEPLGGAHRDHEAIAASLKAAILRNLTILEKVPVPQLLANRAQRLASFGVFSESKA